MSEISATDFIQIKFWNWSTDSWIDIELFADSNNNLNFNDYNYRFVSNMFLQSILINKIYEIVYV